MLIYSSIRWLIANEVNLLSPERDRECVIFEYLTINY